MLQAMLPHARNRVDTEKEKENTPPPPRPQCGSNTGLPMKAADDDDDLCAQSRILQLRKARFRGVPVASGNITPISEACNSPQEPYESYTSDAIDSSPLNARDRQGRFVVVSSPTSGVLQEISNSSLRRRGHNPARIRTSLPRPSSHGTDRRSTRLLSNQGSSDKHPTISANTFEPPISDFPVTESEALDPRSKRRRWSKSIQSRRAVIDDEASKYIEHLESQLASLSTQVQSLTSPSSSKLHSAKLRALNSESNLLRQEVSDWENKFSERLQEQTEQHDVVVGSLRAQLRSLERDAEAMRERLEMLETENEEKKNRALALENANQDLERRLEVMSELIATSPTKVELCSQTAWEARQRSPVRPKSVVLPLAPRLQTTFSPSRHFRHPTSPTQFGGSGERPLASQKTTSWHHSRRTSSTLDSISTVDLTDEDSDSSDGTLMDELPISPTHRRLTLQSLKFDADAKQKSARKMRRFYGGANGPRTLILPATSQANMQAVSAPVSMQPTPILEGQPPVEFNTQAGDLSRPVESFKTRRRSATWDDEAGLASQSRRRGSFAGLARKAPHRAIVATTPLPHTRDFAFPAPYQAIDSARSAGTQGSIEHITGRNLFDELSILQGQEPSTPDIRSTPSSDRKVSGSPEAFEDLASPPTIVLYDNLNISEPDAAQVAAKMSSKARLIQPIRLIGAVANVISRALDSRAPGVRNVLANAWDMVTLSRPVLEFRWWLIKLLIGDLRKKHAMWPKTLSSSPAKDLRYRGLGTSTTPGLGLRSFGHSPLMTKSDHDEALVDCLNHVEESAQLQEQIPSPPPVNWLRLGVTLVFAVGVALKNGPHSLFRNEAATNLNIIPQDKDELVAKKPE